jgi:radical SAM protein with 4Fe4S-binding SPASM domain
MDDTPAQPIVPRCHIPWQQIVIDSNGVVTPCCFWGAYGNNNPPMGNANEESLDKIWNSPGFQNLRKHMAEGNLEAAGCAKCLALKQQQPLAFQYDTDSVADTSTLYGRNIKVLQQEIASGATVLAGRPTMISLTPSHRCNIRCTHCYQESTRSLDLARRSVNQEVLDLAPYLVRLIAGGGEPFLLPIWRQFLKGLDNSQNPYLDFGTTTNGTVISAEIEEGLRKFKRVTLNVSLDGTGVVFEKVRVGADFAVVRDNLRKLRTIARSARSRASTITISMCVMKSNVKDLPNVIRFVAQEELDWYDLSPVATEPQDESLACFNDPTRETEGWHEAYDEARRLACDDFLAILKRYRSSQEIARARESLLKSIELVRQATPWHLLDKKHLRVRIEVPREKLAEASSHVPPGHPLMAYIYPEGRPTGDRPLYYAWFNGESFEVSLPEGAYDLGISSKWLWRGPVPGFRFVVKKGWLFPRVIYFESLRTPTIWDRLFEKASAYKTRLLDRVNAGWLLVRKLVKACLKPVPPLFRLFKILDLSAFHLAAIGRTFLSHVGPWFRSG